VFNACPLGPFSLFKAIRKIPAQSQGEIVLGFFPEKEALISDVAEIYCSGMRTRVKLAGTGFVADISLSPDLPENNQFEINMENILIGESQSQEVKISNNSAYAISTRLAPPSHSNPDISIHLDPPGDISSMQESSLIFEVAPKEQSCEKQQITQQVFIWGLGYRYISLSYFARKFSFFCDQVTYKLGENSECVSSLTPKWKQIENLDRKSELSIWVISQPTLTLRHLKPTSLKVDPKKPLQGNFNIHLSDSLSESIHISAMAGSVEVGKFLQLHLHMKRSNGQYPIPTSIVEYATGLGFNEENILVTMNQELPPAIHGTMKVNLLGGYDCETKKVITDPAPRVWEFQILSETETL
jgi:hypothetical protein